MSWRVDFFVDIRGGAPVEEFLAGLPVQHKAKALALIKMLEQEGPTAEARMELHNRRLEEKRK